jgi:S-formylglutathione hydrolase FrmB
VVRRVVFLLCACGAGALGGPTILAAGAAAPAAPASPVCVPRARPPVADLRVAASSPVAGHQRVSDVTFESKAIAGKVHADVLLPSGYASSPATRYPVLYLLHGHGGNHSDWVSHNVDKVVGDAPVIVVMPDGGYDGWYSDWYGSDVDGHAPDPAPAWETFHLRELLPWVDRTYRTIADRRGRAVAGLSMGGFGAISYAARHPDLFVAAATFSGAVDININYPVGGAATALVANVPDGKQPDGCIWGDPVTQNVVWRDHDPTELARNLHGLSIYQAWGNGQSGPHDDPSKPSPGAMFTEFGINQMNQAFDQALSAEGVPHTVNAYGAGTHSWGYWLDDLGHFLPQMRAAFATPPSAPPQERAFDFESAGAPVSVWGWTFTPHRDATEMTYLRAVRSNGFDVAGSGVLHVDTPALYRPGAAYRVRGTGRPVLRARADGGGRLHFDVSLGASHPTQQYLFGPAAETAFSHARVTIEGR